MEINIELKRKDYADFNKYHFLKKGLRKRVLTVIIVAFAIPSALLINKPFEPLTFILAILASGFLFGTFYFGSMYIIMMFTRTFPSKDGSILGKKTFKITNDGLLEESENNINLQKWQGIKSIESNSNTIFIYVDKVAAYIIPKRFFKDLNEQNEFINIIKNRIATAT